MIETLREADIVRNIKTNVPNMENVILLSSVVVSADENLSCDLQGEAVVLNLGTGIYFGLNPLGARIWELIQKPTKVGDVLDELLKEYKVDPSECQADLLAFLSQLRSQDLVKLCGAKEQ
jgi:hypothetical protein